MGRDPMLRTRKYLEAQDLWDAEQQAKADEKARALVHEVVRAALNVEKPATQDLFDYTFAELPPQLQRQRDTLRTDSIGQDPARIGLAPPKEREVESQRDVIAGRPG